SASPGNDPRACAPSPLRLPLPSSLFPLPSSRFPLPSSRFPLPRVLVPRTVLGCRSEGGRPLPLLALADAPHRLHEISVVDRLLGVPADVAIHHRERTITLHRRRISLNVEREHSQKRRWNRAGSKVNRALIYAPLVAALL